LEDVRNQLELLRSELGLDFGLAVVIQPEEISILVLVLVESLEVGGARLHGGRDSARGLVVYRPVSSGEDFDSEFNSSDQWSLLVVSELLLKVLAQLHVLEHLCHFVNLVKSALNLELLQHDFLGFHRQHGLVQEPLRQVLDVRLHEYVTSVKAAEQSDDCVQSLLCLLI